MPQSYRDPIEFYRTHADEFAQARRDNGMEGDWIEAFMAQLPPGGSVLDAGCGTGEPVARKLVQAGFALTGLDATPAFLDLARRHLPQAKFIEADLRDFTLAREFDGIIAWHSLFHLSQPEQRAALRRLARHCRPGAVLMFTAGPRAGEAVNPCFGENLYHASLAPSEYRAILLELGFAVLRYVEDDRTAGGSTVWLARRGPA